MLSDIPLTRPGILSRERSRRRPEKTDQLFGQECKYEYVLLFLDMKVNVMTAFQDSVKFPAATRVQYRPNPSDPPQGPFLVAKVNRDTVPPKYTLCDDDGNPVNGGSEVDEGCLSLAS